MVDGSGLSLAPLDAEDLVPVASDDLGLAGDAPIPAGVLDRPAVEACGPAATARVPAPTVLRIQDEVVVAWSDQMGGYVALDPTDLAVLAAGCDGASVADLAAAVDRSLDAVGRSVAVLASVGVALVTDGATVEAPDPDPVEPDVAMPSSGTVDDEASRAEPAPTPGALPSIWADLPRHRSAVRIVVYRMVGRVKRRIAAPRKSRLDEPEPVRVEAAPVAPAAPVETAAAPAVPPAEASAQAERPPAGEGRQPVSTTMPAPWAERDARVPVFAVYHSPEHNASLGLGLIVAHARQHRGGVLNNAFDLRRAQIDSEPVLEELGRRSGPAVVLFADYLWSVDRNLEVSAQVKQLAPSAITVHGGPHAPKYEQDAERFFAAHPHVDVIVRGEGELTVAAMLEALGPGAGDGLDLDRLADVAGLTYRRPGGDGSELVRTPDRERAEDMAQFPSPYLTGEFDAIDPSRWRSATVETNRGCPYGCTYCDWGSATLSRIRKFPLERVEAELEWVAARGISEVFLADANFGIFARDVEIARHIAELKERYGAPQGVICSFAKNTTKYTTEIVRIWVEAGICAEGSVALQTTDPVTLRNVRRSNIRIERYDDLAEEFRRLGLPIVTDLLMGLPGSTVESFKEDLQRCIDREVTPRMMETVVLPNSPMNEPSYRQAFAVETDENQVIVSTSSFDRADFDEMLRLRLLFRSLEHYGLLRHLLRWVQHTYGIRAVDLIHDIDRAISTEPERYPLLTWVGRYFDLVTVPPGGWEPFYDEVVDLLASRHGIETDAAMATVLRVQAFLMPTVDREFPAEIDLDHDYVSWYRSTLGGPDVDPDAPTQLAEHPPGRLIVDDPAGVCDGRLLKNQFSIRRIEACDNPFWVLNDWELRSDLMRPMATAVPVLSG